MANYFKSFFSQPVSKSTQVRSFTSVDAARLEKWGNSFFYPIDLHSNASYQALKDMYEQLPEVQAPVNYIVDKMANVTYGHFRGDNEVKDSKVMAVMKKPNHFQREADLIKSYFLNYIVLGAGYINRIKPVTGRNVKELFILPTMSTEPVIKENSKADPRLNEIVGYRTNFGQGELQLTADEVVMVKESNLSSNYTCVQSRLLSAILTSESLKYNYQARVKIYKDRGALGVISPANEIGAIDKDAADQMRNQYYQENGITAGKAPFLVSAAPLQYTSIGLSVNDLQLNENKLQDFQTICSVLNIDSSLFENSRGTYNNKILAKKNFWEDVGMPHFNAFLEVLTEVFKLPANESLIADYSDIPALQEDYEKKVNANSKIYNDGAITQAEYREAVGFEGGENTYKQEPSGGNTSGQGNEQNNS